MTTALTPPRVEKADKKDNDCDITENQDRNSDTTENEVNDPFTQKDSSHKVDPPMDTDHSPNKCDSTKSPYSLRKQVKRPQRYID